MNKLIHIINSMNEQELKLIQKDLFEGNISYLIKKRLNEKKKEVDENKVCPVCGTKLTEVTAKYILVFGLKDFRKKAMFDEIDCLGFFISKLKNLEIEKLKQ